MGRRRTPRSNEFKAKVALEAIQGAKSLSELGSEYHVAPKLIALWKKRLLAGAPHLFAHEGDRTRGEDVKATLHEEIERLKIEIDWLRKKL